MTDKPTDTEIFKAVVECMHQEVKTLQENVTSAERSLGSEVADRPGGDHKAAITNVLLKRAELDGAKRLFSIVMGFRSGQLLPKRPE